jgi:hypothetical protein
MSRGRFKDPFAQIHYKFFLRDKHPYALGHVGRVLNRPFIPTGPGSGRGRIQIEPLPIGAVTGEHRICITAGARTFSDRYTERAALGSSNPRIAVFALRRPLDICLFSAAIIYCDFHKLEGTDTDSGPLRVSGSVH